MKAISTLILAVRIFLSLGIGTAMAQGLIPSGGEAAYVSAQHQAAPRTANLRVGQSQLDLLQSGQVPLGSSDMTTIQ
jgi:hypothetical protein